MKGNFRKFNKSLSNLASNISQHARALRGRKNLGQLLDELGITKASGNSDEQCGFKILPNFERFRQKNLRELDSSLAGVVQALKTSRRFDNSVIIFVSDNGAREWSDPSLPNHNAPLRGAKGSVYEGGTKVPAVIHSPTLLRGARR